MHATPHPRAIPTGLPAQAGIGLKLAHCADLLADAGRPAFVEIHAENHFGAGGAPHAWLRRVREHCALSVHGVGLSLGGAGPPDETHLDRLDMLLRRYAPASFSEHLAWSSHGGAFFNDLLPLPCTAATLHRVCDHIDRVQERLRVRMLLENPATYVEFAESTLDEGAFLGEVVRRTGCGLLLDVNNLFVSCRNHGRELLPALDALPLHAVGEIHLAGFTIDHDASGAELLIDHHGAPVADAVWALYREALQRTGPVATLIEWDNDVPAYATLKAEALRAERELQRMRTERSAA